MTDTPDDQREDVLLYQKDPASKDRHHHVQPPRPPECSDDRHAASLCRNCWTGPTWTTT